MRASHSIPLFLGLALSGCVVENGENHGTSNEDLSLPSFTTERLFFVANDGTNGEELWMSGGTAATTAMVKDIRSGPTGSSPKNLTAFGEALYFSANDGASGFELWKSDGTAAGTVRV